MSGVPVAGAPKEKKKSFFSFLAWWQTDPIEVEKQVTEYSTLKVWQSARGISLLLCAFTIAVTVLLGSFIGLASETIVAEAVIWSVLGLLMFRGQRWAFIAVMLFVDLGKGSHAIRRCGRR